MKNVLSKQQYVELFHIITKHKVKIILTLTCMLTMAISTGMLAWMIKPILKNMFANKNEITLNILPSIIILIYSIRALSMYGQEYYINYVSQDFARTLRNKLYSSIINFPISTLEKKQTGTLMSSLTYDVNIIKIMISTAVAGSIKDILTIIVLTIVIFYLDWKLASFAFIALPISLIPIIKLGKKIRNISNRVQETMADLNTFIHETLIGNKIVKAFNMEEYEKKQFAKKTNQIFSAEMKNTIAKALSSPTTELLGGISIAFIIWYGGHQVISENSTAETFMAFIGAVAMLYDPIKKLTKVNNYIQEGLAALDRIFNLIETKKENNNNQLIKLKKSPHQIEFKNVSFNYDKKKILKNINLKAKPEKIIAIVGASGEGKTSLINLIPRFYKELGGTILIDNIDIKKISLSSLREQVAIVPQEPILFNDTIKNNIIYGKINATANEIKEAAKAAYAYDFIKKSDKKFNTKVGEFGNKLSGGEKQRICIARALLKNAPILILDEATSALDITSAMLIQKAIENLIKGRTTFIIAHRLSTIVNADEILVLSQGYIIEQGSHKNLIKKRGQYCKLYDSINKKFAKS